MDVRRLVKQEQFLDVLDEAQAHRRWSAACTHLVAESERVPLDIALGRVLADHVRAPVDVPGFDRSNVDGFAVRARDTYGAEEERPRDFALHETQIAAGAAAPRDFELRPGEAVCIATGGALPRGADAVVMIEDTLPVDDARLLVQRAVTPGAHVTWAGTDIGRGDLVQVSGTQLTSRETGMLAAVGVDVVTVVRRPRVAILSTGDEIRAPGEPLAVGEVYDSNARILADAVRELGGEPVPCGIVADDAPALAAELRGLLCAGAAAAADVVLLSGGTSKGAGDLNHRVVADLAQELPESPGILVHGVALKPGKPICLAVLAGTPVVILPGFPTSAVFTFHEFVAPLVRRLAGLPGRDSGVVAARAPLRIPSVVGRTQYVLVNLIEGTDGVAAYPLGAGSGSVSAFARADGFVRIPHEQEFVTQGAELRVRLLGEHVRAADLVAIGSHCVGLDLLLSAVGERGFRTKSIVVGSQGGLAALARGEGDVAGVHLLDAASGEYNRPFLPDGVGILGGYGRRQGIVFRTDDPCFDASATPAEAVRAACAAGCRMVNRNAGSGTRVLLDELLAAAGVDSPPDGHAAQARSHNAVAAAVAQGRADWGVTLDVLAAANDLSFTFLREERFDLAVRDDRRERPAVRALVDLLRDEAIGAQLRGAGLLV